MKSSFSALLQQSIHNCLHSRAFLSKRHVQFFKHSHSQDSQEMNSPIAIRGKTSILSLGEGVLAVFALQHWICHAEVASLTWQYISNNTIVAVNVRCNIVFANSSHLIDTKSVPIPCKVHCRE